MYRPFVLFALCLIASLASREAAAQPQRVRFTPSADLEKLDVIPEASNGLAIFIEEKFGRPDAPIPWNELPVDFGARNIATGKATGWKLLAGNSLFNKHCADCHGTSGDGAGPKAAKLEPHPRDFRRGRFKFRSTSADPFPGKPLRHDLHETLRLGVPGTAMPAFDKLQPGEADALVEYVRWLAIRGEFESMVARLLEDAADKAEVEHLLAEDYKGDLQRVSRDWLLAERESSILRPPKRIAPDAESLAAGKRLFNDKAVACYKCHGTDGKGVPNLFQPRESSESPVWDLTSGLYRGGIEPNDVFRRLRAGMIGSVMPIYSEKFLSDEDTWHVVNYTLSLAPKDVREKQARRGPTPQGLDDDSPLEVAVTSEPTSPSPKVAWKGWGTLRGRFIFRGEPPATPPLPVSGDVAVCGKQQENESLVIDKEGGLANVVIYLRTKDTPWQQVIQRRKDPAVLSVVKCRFDPHVMVVQVEDELLVKNRDPIGQNVCLTSNRDAGFNYTLSAGGEARLKLRVVHDQPAPLSSTIRPHMLGYVLPRDNPYFAVTAKDGTFEIRDLPAGAPLEFQVWHERASKGLEAGGFRQGRFSVELVADEAKNLGNIEVTAAMVR